LNLSRPQNVLLRLNIGKSISKVRQPRIDSEQ